MIESLFYKYYKCSLDLQRDNNKTHKGILLQHFLPKNFLFTIKLVFFNKNQNI